MFGDFLAGVETGVKVQVSVQLSGISLQIHRVIEAIDGNSPKLYCSTVELEHLIMEIVAVKNKFQIVIPQHIREQVHVEIGDLLEASVEDGKITFTPKSLIDRHLAEGLEDAKHGRTHGPYTNARDAIRALETRAKRHAKKRGQ